MPIYEYQCESGHSFEELQSVVDDPITVCPQCGAASRRVLHAPAIHFKGSGFYTTDYGRANGKGKSRERGSGQDSERSGSGESESSSSSSGSEKSGKSGKSEKPAGAGG